MGLRRNRREAPGKLVRRLRFCFVTTFYPPYHFGGDGVFVYRLAEALAARGHDVHVLHSLDAFRATADRTEPVVSFRNHANVTLFPLETSWPRLSALSVQQSGRPAAYARDVERHFATHRYDVIHYHNVSLMGAPALFRLGNAVKLYTAHEYWLICPTHVLFKDDREPCVSRACVRCMLSYGRPPQIWRSTGLMDACLGEIDGFIMPSRFALDRHLQDGLPGDATVLPHFVPLPSDDEPCTEAVAGERPFFFFAGRLEKLKGVQDLVRVFAEIRDADLLVAGTGGLEPELRTMARDLPHVRFLGARHPSEIGQYYRRATAVLVPSLCYETFALVGAEALAHGTPLVGRRIGAVAELVETSGGGLLFDTMAECRDGMRRLLDEPELRAHLGSTGRRHALRHWTEDAHLDRYFALVESHMERRGAGTSRPLR